MTPEALRRSARKKLKHILITHDYKCYWCKKKINDWKVLKKLPGVTVLNVGNTDIVYLQDGLQKTIGLATTDHLVEIKNGGTSDIANLVPACRKCNSSRSNPAPSIKSKKKKICVLCKKKKDLKNKAYCLECRGKNNVVK